MHSRARTRILNVLQATAVAAAGSAAAAAAAAASAAMDDGDDGVAAAAGARVAPAWTERVVCGFLETALELEAAAQCETVGCEVFD